MTNGLLNRLVDNGLGRVAPARAEGLTLPAGSEPLIDVIAAGSRVRREFFGMRVKPNTIINMKSVLCQEDCGYCSQRRGSQSEVPLPRRQWLRAR
ncbi:hypothetical protein ACFXHA_03430 [Nocardia sp. NPDC059240]|uniref:hypothetical protein n=1 Tax=Nocardia sp. NPDC059240 TaxID=3346786 RepID=UPI0036CC5F19